MLSKCEVHSEQLIDVMSEDLVRKLYINVKKLVDSSNFKLKSRTLNLLKHLILLVSQLVLPSTHLFLLFAKGILHILRNFLLHQKDSKLHYYSLFNIGLLF